MIQYFGHTLATRDIVIRQDSPQSTQLENLSGKYFPLIRIGEWVMGFDQILSMELNIGDSFLPQLTISFDDGNFKFSEQDFETGIFLLTLFVGNAQDSRYKPIKNDYLIRSIDSSSASSIFTLECELYVPNLLSTDILSYEGNSLDVLTKVAESCNLGFISNVINPDDAQVWIKPHTYQGFIDNVVAKSFIDSDASMIAFVDQWANLNFLDLNLVNDAGANTFLETHPYSGSPLETPIPLLISNNRMNSEEQIQLSVDHYIPVTNYGVEALNNPESLELGILGDDFGAGTVVTLSSKFNQILQDEHITKINCHNTHRFYEVADNINAFNREIIQGAYLDLQLSVYSPTLYSYQNVDVEIWNFIKYDQPVSQDPLQSNRDLQDNPDLPYKNQSYTLNTKLTGEYMIVGMEIVYSPINYMDKEPDQGLKQKIKAFQKYK